MISKKNQFDISFYQVYFLEISLPPVNGVENAMKEKVSVPPFIYKYIPNIIHHYHLIKLQLSFLFGYFTTCKLETKVQSQTTIMGGKLYVSKCL